MYIIDPVLVNQYILVRYALLSKTCIISCFSPYKLFQNHNPKSQTVPKSGIIFTPFQMHCDPACIRFTLVGDDDDRPQLSCPPEGGGSLGGGGSGSSYP